MNELISRRNLLGRAGLALGGAVTLGALPACDQADAATPPQPQVKDFPYEKFLPANYQLDADAIREAAYQAYYAGGCCHGAYSALVGHLAATVGAPFDLLPLDQCKFGGGGIASYGSICGAVLGGVLVVNMVVQNPTLPPPGSAAGTAPQDVRAALLTELMRWYETFQFPEYVPLVRHANEHQNKDVTQALVTTVAFSTDASGVNDAAIRRAPGSHLCHASVTSWCKELNVTAAGADKLARCARLTGDVAGKTAELLNGYLASNRLAFTGAATNGAVGCVTCHTKTAVANPAANKGPSVNAGMACGSCHPNPHAT